MKNKWNLKKYNFKSKYCVQIVKSMYKKKRGIMQLNWLKSTEMKKRRKKSYNNKLNKYKMLLDCNKTRRMKS